MNFILAVPIAWVSITLCIWIAGQSSNWRPRTSISLRTSVLLASVILGMITVLSSELLSAFKMLSRQTIVAVWLILSAGSAGCLALCLYRWRTARHQWFARLKDPIATYVAKQSSSTMLVFVIVFQVATLAMVAYVYAPSTWDSLAYHLARIEHWIQNKSVAQYATHYYHQVQFPSFAEYAMMHSIFLAARDQYVNFVQFFAMLICAAGISEITRLLGASGRWQLGAVALTLAIPTGILEATSTQNDYVAAAGIVLTLTFLLYLITDWRSLLWLAALANSIGISLFVKGTTYAYLLPVCALVGVFLLQKMGGARFGAFGAHYLRGFRDQWASLD